MRSRREHVDASGRPAASLVATGEGVTFRAVVLVLLSVVTVACGGGSSGQQGRAAVSRDRNPVTVGPGRLVSIGGGRSLFLYCLGTGSPTVILESGFGGNINDWREVQGPLGHATRTCAYDRAGLVNSPAIPGVHDAATEVADLRRLLDHAGIPPPYVLVGHSYGGILVRLFAHAHPSDTAGLVLVDAMGRNQDRRLLPIWQAQPAAIRHLLPKPGSLPVQDGVNIMAGEALDAEIGTLGDIRLVVITRGRPDDSGPPLPAAVQGPVDRLWTTMQDELAALSSDHVHVIALRSGHFVQLSFNGQPDVVIAAVLAVVHAARTGTHLPSCPHLFHGADVRCRA